MPPLREGDRYFLGLRLLAQQLLPAVFPYSRTKFKNGFRNPA
jgi:hypothetical protein